MILRIQDEFQVMGVIYNGNDFGFQHITEKNEKEVDRIQRLKDFFIRELCDRFPAGITRQHCAADRAKKNVFQIRILKKSHVS